MYIYILEEARGEGLVVWRSWESFFFCWGESLCVWVWKSCWTRWEIECEMATADGVMEFGVYARWFSLCGSFGVVTEVQNWLDSMLLREELGCSSFEASPSILWLFLLLNAWNSSIARQSFPNHLRDDLKISKREQPIDPCRRSVWRILSYHPFFIALLKRNLV